MEKSEEYLQGVKDCAEAIQKKLVELANNSDKGLENLNKQYAGRYNNINSRYDLEIDYYINVATYAWGYRGQKISLLYLQGTIQNLIKEPQTLNQ